MVVHGTRDTIVPFAMGRALYDSAPNKARFVAVEGGGHNDLQDAFADDYWPPIIAFIKGGV